MATQAEVLQKVTDYCTEKQYTLNDSFRSKFSEKFANANTDADISDENVLNSIKFNIDTAFSAASQELKVKDETWKTKEAEYLKQIETLKKEPEGNKGGGKEETVIKQVIPEDQMEYLKYAKELMEKETLATKKKSIVELASKNFTSAEQKAGFEKFIETQNIDTTKDPSELSEKFSSVYGSIFKETIGENKVYQSGGDGAGKFDDVWAKQAERIKNDKK
jgi:hypothetical protein